MGQRDVNNGSARALAHQISNGSGRDGTLEGRHQSK